MNTSVLVALVSAVGNLIQGWDNAVVGGVIVHIRREFKWEDKPSMVGLTVALPLIGATVITMCSGRISDWLGRRPMLTASSLVYVISGVLMLWSPNVYLLLLAQLLTGCAIGLAVTFVPMYISEMAPAEVRGLLSTLPQFVYTGRLFAGNAFVFFMSLFDNASSWRFILGILFAPSIVFCALTIFYLPESPRWLLSKGQVVEANRALQRLRGKEDVSAGEMALLVEGLEVGGETTIEEYVIGPQNMVDEEEQRVEKEEIKMLGLDGITSMVALRVSESITTTTAAASEQGRQSSFAVDPVVSLMDSVHGNTFFAQLGSMFSEQGGHQPKTEEWGEAGSARHDDQDYASGAVSECDDSSM